MSERNIQLRQSCKIPVYCLFPLASRLGISCMQLSLAQASTLESHHYSFSCKYTQETTDSNQSRHACRHHHISRPRLSKSISQSHLMITFPASPPRKQPPRSSWRNLWGLRKNASMIGAPSSVISSVQLYQHSQPPATTKPHRQILQLLTGNASKAVALHTYTARAEISFDEISVPSCSK